jgi:hypothetical protein
MAIVQGIREKVHLPLYDSMFVEPEKQLRELERSSTLKFFVNVQNKTRLETNLQSASLLPHYNTFEARAMRVVISDLPPTFPDSDEHVASSDDVEDLELFLTDEDDNGFDSAGNVVTDPNGALEDFTAVVEADLSVLVEILKDARESEDGYTFLSVDDDEVVDVLDGSENSLDDTGAVFTALSNRGAGVWISTADLEGLIESLDDKAPPQEQVRPNDGAGNLISKLIYNTVTTFYVGEKVMIEMPTFFFPAGSGTHSPNGKSVNHGEPNPLATFRFAEPIFIDRQQNFRVEIEVPDADTLKDVQKIYGPFNIWVIIDGYMTRGVQ